MWARAVFKPRWAHTQSKKVRVTQKTDVKQAEVSGWIRLAVTYICASLEPLHDTHKALGNAAE